MKFTLVAFLGFFLVAEQTFAADEPKTISRTFNVEPDGEVIVDVDQGNIQVSAGSQNTVEVVVEREVSGVSEGRAQSTLKNHKVRLTQDGNNVRVEAATAKSHSLFSHKQGDLNVHFRITVPKHFNATLTTSGGDIEVSVVRGALDVRTSGGDLKFFKIEGPIEGHTSGGNIRAEGCTDKLMAQTSGGSIVIKDYTGLSATADTLGGTIDVAGCEGKLQAKTSGGNINISEFTGAGVFADTSGGSVAFDLAKQPADECALRTSGGNVTVRLAENVAVNVNATTDGGDVTTAIPVSSTIQGKVKEGHVEGTINGGGPLLLLKSGGGNVEILKR
jgi:DUF4097 and DUF4098 domain-containing protein YvlB